MGERVLIVDDNPTNLKLVAYLVKAKGYEVDTAADADARWPRSRPTVLASFSWTYSSPASTVSS